MSDEFRDLLKHRADEVHVPASDLADVIRGGNARKWRTRAYSVGVMVLVAVVGWATVPGLLDRVRDDGRAPNIADTPTPAPTPTEAAGRCETASFRPTYLPDGWSYELQEGSGGQQGIPIDRQSPQALGHYTVNDSAATVGGFIDVQLYGAQYVLAPDAPAIEVMGDEGRIGQIHDGYAAEFTHEGCDFSLSAFGPPMDELRQVAKGLRPTDGCTGMPVNGRTMNLGDGRFFGYIDAMNASAVEFDRAEFLTGTEANEAAVAAGDIQAGETVPNDYYIVNEDRATGRFPLADDVNVIIDTIHDGMPGAAPADLLWLMCEFADLPADDLATVSHATRPFWLTVRNGRVVEIEEQYLP